MFIITFSFALSLEMNIQDIDSTVLGLKQTLEELRLKTQKKIISYGQITLNTSLNLKKMLVFLFPLVNPINVSSQVKFIPSVISPYNLYDINQKN